MSFMRSIPPYLFSPLVSTTSSKQPHRYNEYGGCDGEEHFPNRKEGASKNCYQGQTLPLRPVSQKKPETCENSRSLVLSQLPEPRQTMTNYNGFRCFSGSQTPFLSGSQTPFGN